MFSSPRLKAAFGLGLLVLLAFHLALNLQQDGLIYLQADAYTHGLAKRPYQYRVLMAPVLGELITWLSQDAPRRLLTRLPTYVSTPESAAYLCINVAAFTTSLVLMPAIARRALGSQAGVRLAMVVYVALAYSFVVLSPNRPFILPYDLPALALVQGCLLAVLTRRWAWVYPLFALATLNRETSFLVVVFLVARWLPGRSLARRDGLHVAALSLVWLAIKAGLWWRFSGLPSDEGLRLVYNLQSLAKPWQWPALLPLLASFGLALRALRTDAEQREWAITGCIGFGLIFCVGQMLETRAFADLTTFFAIAIARAGWPAVSAGRTTAG